MLRKAATLIFTAICLFLLCGDTLAGQALPLDKIMDPAEERYGITAASAVVVESGKVVYVSHNAGGLYCVGSVSKSFVAALALKLAEEGALGLDDTIGRYLPDFPHWNRDIITLRDLLSMRSGIGDYTKGFESADYFKEYTQDELIKRGMRHSALLSRGDFVYSNTNILIARQMIEAATGRGCEELIREKILVPMKLKNTYFSEEKEAIRSKLVPGYAQIKGGGRIDCTDTASSWADLACGMYSTAADMAKWADILILGDFLGEAAQRELLNFLSVREGTEYGLCVARKTLWGQEVILLSGNVPGYTAAVLIQGDRVCAVLLGLSDYSGSGVSFAELIADEIMIYTEEK